MCSLENEVARYTRLLQSFMGNAKDAQFQAFRLASFFDVLNQTGLIDDQVILGEEFLGMQYSPVESCSDSGVCYQAAILMPHGIGVLLMDTDTRYELSRIVPVLILVALLPKLRQYGYRPPRGRIPELLRKLEKRDTTLLVR